LTSPALGRVEIKYPKIAIFYFEISEHDISLRG